MHVCIYLLCTTRCVREACRCTYAEATARRYESTQQQTCRSALQQSHKRLHSGCNTPPSVLALVPFQPNPLMAHNLVLALKPLGRAAAGCPCPGLIADCVSCPGLTHACWCGLQVWVAQQAGTLVHALLRVQLHKQLHKLHKGGILC